METETGDGGRHTVTHTILYMYMYMYTVLLYVQVCGYVHTLHSVIFTIHVLYCALLLFPLFLKARANDPNRLKNRGGKLLQEQRQQQRVEKEYPKVHRGTSKHLKIQACRESQYMQVAYITIGIGKCLLPNI